MTEIARRASVLIAVAALVAIGGMVDTLVGRPVPAHPAPPPAAAGDLIAPVGAESSAWYCVGGTDAGGGAVATISLTNPTSRPVTGTVRAVASNGHVGMAAVTVPAGSTTSVVPTQVAGAGPAAATVELDGGGVAVTQTVSGPLGWSSAPCASTTSDHWYFAHASTASGDTAVLTLYNPGATVAIADVTLVTSTAGTLQPAGYQEVDLPPGAFVSENLGDHAQNDPSVATEVETLSGTVVAAQLQTFGQPAHGGLALVSGSGAAPSWSFPQSTVVDGGSVVFRVLNPSATTARVTVSLGLQSGRAEPVSLTVPPGSVASLDGSTMARIPANVAFGITFTAAGGIGIVVSREVVAPAAAPVPQVGEVPGVAGSSPGWLVVAVAPPGTGNYSLAVLDLSGAPVSLTVRAWTGGAARPVRGLDGVTVEPGVPLVLGPTPAVPAGMLEISAEGPVSVEFDPVPVGSPGVEVTPALPWTG